MKACRYLDVLKQIGLAGSCLSHIFSVFPDVESYVSAMRTMIFGFCGNIIRPWLLFDSVDECTSGVVHEFK